MTPRDKTEHPGYPEAFPSGWSVMIRISTAMPQRRAR
jgi:hypothetical protein